MERVSYSLIGHRSRCFDVRYSSCFNYAISASEDATSRLWNLATKKCIHTFKHNESCEVLRSAFVSKECDVVCSCGSDGNATLWKATTSLSEMSASESVSYDNIAVLSHGDQQIYSCETLGVVPNRHVMTASEDALHFWDLSDGIRPDPQTMYLSGAQAAPATASFGGPRNPDNVVYVFDAKPAVTGSEDVGSFSGPTDTLIAVALSDGTVQVVDIRLGVAVLSFTVALNAEDAPKSHTTSVSWSPDKSTLSATLGCGDLALWDLRASRTKAYVEGAHSSACFGSVFANSGQATETASTGDGNVCSAPLASWSSDGSIRVWDSNTLSDKCDSTNAIGDTSIPNYPIFCAAAGAPGTTDLLIAGGSSETSFIGTLIHSVDVWPHAS